MEIYLVFIDEENKSKEIQGKNVLSFTKIGLWGFWLGGGGGERLSCHLIEVASGSMPC